MNALIEKFLYAKDDGEAVTAGNALYSQIEADPMKWLPIIEAELETARRTITCLEDMRVQAEAAKFDRVYLETLNRVGGEL